VLTAILSVQKGQVIQGGRSLFAAATEDIHINTWEQEVRPGAHDGTPSLPTSRRNMCSWGLGWHHHTAANEHIMVESSAERSCCRAEQRETEDDARALRVLTVRSKT
jgi:hypothetical protein